MADKGSKDPPPPFLADIICEKNNKGHLGWAYPILRMSYESLGGGGWNRCYRGELLSIHVNNWGVGGETARRAFCQSETSRRVLGQSETARLGRGQSTINPFI